MEPSTFLQTVIAELKQASILNRISFIADLFTILGVSLAALFIKPTIEWILKRDINAANFFGFGSFLLFWILVFFALLVGYTYLKPFFQKLRFGLFFYYGLIVVYFFLGFAMMSSIGFEFIIMMLRSQ